MANPAKPDVILLRNLVLMLRKQGFTYTAIARMLGISKQLLRCKLTTNSRLSAELWERCKEVKQSMPSP